MSREALKVIWLAKKGEESLAAYQGSQGSSNNCAEFALAAALSLLFRRKITGSHLAELADKGWLTKGLRFWPGGPTSPKQQVRLAREYCRLHELKLNAGLRQASLADLRCWLAKPARACLVTIAWDNRNLPVFEARGGMIPRAGKSRFFWSGHTMVLAAYRPPQKDAPPTGGLWGFINSWAEPGARSLFWMAEDEFLRCYDYYLFPVGSRNVVVLDRVPSRPGSRRDSGD